MSENKNHQSNDNTRNSTEVFADYARYYNLLYKDKDYSAEAKYVAGLIRKFHPSAQSILELGSGTGKHACLLTNIGYKVHGIERSPEMLAQSLNSTSILLNTDVPCPSFSQGDIRTARLSRQFDVVIALFHVISYQTTNEDVTAAFETVRHHLKPGGIFIFDIWYGPAVLTEHPEVRIKRMVDETIEITRLAEPVLHPNENRVDVHYHVFVRDLATRAVTELKETHNMRYFFKTEIELIADWNVLKILNSEEWLTGRPIGSDTWGTCFVLQTADR